MSSEIFYRSQHGASCKVTDNFCGNYEVVKSKFEINWKLANNQIQNETIIVLIMKWRCLKKVANHSKKIIFL